MKNIFNVKLITHDFFLGIVLLILSGLFAFWINNKYSEPQIEFTNNGGFYGVIDGHPIGTIFIVNSGYSTEKNISIKIDASVDESQVSIPNLIGDYEVKKLPDGTVITINELRPSERAQIFFSPEDQGAQYFEIIDILAPTTNIYESYPVGKWHLSSELMIIVIFFVSLAFFIGWHTAKKMGKNKKSILVG